MTTATEGTKQAPIRSSSRYKRPEPTLPTLAEEKLSILTPGMMVSTRHGDLMYVGKRGKYAEADGILMSLISNSERPVAVQLYRVTPDSHLTPRGELDPIEDGTYTRRRESTSFTHYLEFWLAHH
jgi:hypothetical protein